MLPKPEETLDVNEGNIALAIIGAAIAAFFGAILWATLVYVVAYRASYLLPGIGYLVGKVIHKVKGDGYGLRFGLIGVFFTLCGCFLANLLYVLMDNYNAEIVEMIPGENRRTELSFLAHAMLNKFRPTDLFLLLAAVYLGFTMTYKDKKNY
jgi:hypothetical protein